VLKTRVERRKADMSVYPAVIQYVCSDKACGAQAGAPFMVKFLSEALLDEKNIATLFCSRGKKNCFRQARG
jgi:hypothetical protein